MKPEVRHAGMIIILIVAIGDGFTTFLGFASVFKPTSDNPTSLILCIFPSLAILLFLLFSRQIWRIDQVFFKIIVRGVWFIAFFIDFWTSFRAGIKLVTEGPMSIIAGDPIIPLIKSVPHELVITLFFATVIVSGCPLLFSFIIREG